MVKAEKLEVIEEMILDKKVINTKQENKQTISGLDINEIIKKAQGFYSKNEQGLAGKISLGTSIIRPSKDSDFIMWEGGDFWSELTKLRGIPWGRFIMVAGRPDSGKSSLAAQFMSYTQKQEHFVILLDSEQKFQKKRYDEQMGGDSSKLLVVDTNSIIDGCKGVAYLVRTIKEQSATAKILIVFDSLGAAINSSENNEENEDMSRQPGAAAKELTWCYKKWARLINQYQNRDTGEHTISVLAINQVYAQIGFMKSGYKTKGGDAPEYMSSIIIMLNKKKDLTKIKNGKKIKYGILSRAKVSKNHMFDGSDCLAEADIVISATGVELAEEVKKKDTDVQGWEDGSEE